MEIELKLEVAAADAEKLLGSELFKSAEGKDLTSVYFDTETQQLRKAGFSLRVRHVGDRRIQTVKAEGPATAGLFVRGEWEQDIVGDAPVLDTLDLPLKQHVGRKVLESIGPAFRARIDRSTAILRDQDATIELVLDRGEIVASDQSSAVCELELELRQGAPAALFQIARRLDAVAPVRLGVHSKSERGYRLADGSARRALKAEPVALRAEMTAATAFRAIAAACIRQFRLNETLLGETHDPGALHQARVGLRRFRSALSLFKPMLADARFDHLRGELRWITGVLGEARNIDVLVARLTEESVLAHLRKGREQAYVEVAEALASPRLRHLMLDLTEWLSLGEWLMMADGATLRDQPIVQAAATMLDRHRQRVKRRGANLVELDDDSRHALRIETKKLRYAAQFFASLYTGKKELRRMKPFRSALDELQEHLGELNDLATMPSVFEKLGIAEPLKRNLAALEAGAAKILRKAEDAYDILFDAKRFWR